MWSFFSVTLIFFWAHLFPLKVQHFTYWEIQKYSWVYCQSMQNSHSIFPIQTSSKPMPTIHSSCTQKNSTSIQQLTLTFWVRNTTRGQIHYPYKQTYQIEMPKHKCTDMIKSYRGISSVHHNVWNPSGLLQSSMITATITIDPVVHWYPLRNWVNNCIDFWGKIDFVSDVTDEGHVTWHGALQSVSFKFTHHNLLQQKTYIHSKSNRPSPTSNLSTLMYKSL